MKVGMVDVVYRVTHFSNKLKRRWQPKHTQFKDIKKFIYAVKQLCGYEPRSERTFKKY
jgi:hypothetical protein